MTRKRGALTSFGADAKLLRNIDVALLVPGCAREDFLEFRTQEGQLVDILELGANNAGEDVEDVFALVTRGAVWTVARGLSRNDHCVDISRGARHLHRFLGYVPGATSF